MQLISAVLGHKQAAIGVEGEAFRVSYSGSVALSGGESLVRLVRVIAPDAAASLKFGARVRAGYFRLPVLRLAGIGGGSDIHVHRTFGIDNEGMQGRVAAQRQSRNDGFGSAVRHDAAGGQ